MDTRVRILMPVFNDWDAARLVIDELDRVLCRARIRAAIALIDDGSTVPPPSFTRARFDAIDAIDLICLRRNVGHQRAIAVGLAYIESRLPCEMVVVMDSDGEDAPSDVVRLLSAADGRPGTVVFGRRAKRSEGPTFRICYALYKLLFSLLTGREIRFGNFSAIPMASLERLVSVAEIWNHFASGVQKSRLPCHEIPVNRAKRLHGESKMNFVSLVTHGLSAIAVHADSVGTRVLVGAGGLVAAAFPVAALVLAHKFITHSATPGWATTALGLILVVVVQVLMFATIFCFLTLGMRAGTSFIPCRDFGPFVLSCRRVHGAEGLARELALAHATRRPHSGLFVVRSGGVARRARRTAAAR